MVARPRRIAEATELPALREPGLSALKPGEERHLVRGAGAVVLLLQPGDRIDIVDLEGGQPAEMAVFTVGGAVNSKLLEPVTDEPVTFLARLAAESSEAGRAFAAGLAAHGIVPGSARGARLFGTDSIPGSRATFTAVEPAIVAVLAPGTAMAPDQQTPPTPLHVFIRRAIVPLAPGLPPPLAPVVDEFRIDRRTARAYRVKAGQYIQVIDVEGRQCSDFLAFHAADLERGLERGLDATTTRTLLGVAYPSPGLLSKFFDQDMRPLVEVVRDTCGRHDSFSLACTAKYYDDLGYPGHPNCTENFNAALAPHGVNPRKGWPAINFFYNTTLDARLQLSLDEPWSRPGDYVLMRALTDLVCASSACPDDIDPANGWDPTDIHIRIYGAENQFSKAVAMRMTPDADPVLTRETAFHSRTSKLSRRMVEYRGFWLPASYTDWGPIAEYHACRERAVVMDLSPLRKFEVTGPDAEVLMNYAFTRDVSKLAVGQVVYTAMCYDTGGMLDDGTIFRLGRDNFRWIGGNEYGGVWLRKLAEDKGLRVWVRSSTDQLHNLAVQGPLSREILKAIIWTPPTQPSIDEVKWFRFTIGRLNKPDGVPLVISRTGYTGELGFELWCHPKQAPEVWDAVWESGQARGLAPLGLDALDMVRIEAGLIFAGYEFCDQTDPFEAGIGFTVPASKTADFVGKAALEERRTHPQRVLVGLELAGEEVAGHGDCVHVGRQQVGIVTSGMRSPILGKAIALARLAIGHAAIGTEVEIGKLDGHQKRLPAKVVRFPFYDPDKLKPRS